MLVQTALQCKPLSAKKQLNCLFHCVKYEKPPLGQEKAFSTENLTPQGQ